jgi:hypothetical protein
MSAKASLAAARRRRGPQPQPIQANSVQRQQSVQPGPPAPTGKVNPANINQYLVFLNNKIETVEKRVSESLKNMENKIGEEVQKLTTVDLTLIEQTVESQKLKISKLNSLMGDLQQNYLALNTTLLMVKEDIKPITSYTSVEPNLTKVSIKEEEEHEVEEEEKPFTIENNKETEADQLSQEPEPEIEQEEQNITHEILEKTD